MLAVRDHRDRQAFSKLFDHYAPRLKGFLMRAGASAPQAEEIVQEVLLTIWQKAAQFDPHRAQVSAWVYQIARNKHIDHVRREKRPEPEMLHQPDEDVPDSGQIVALAQETEHLREALAQLNPEQRRLIEQTYLGELSHGEIKDLTGLPLGTIKSRIRLGLNRLRHEMKALR
ncbi:sigma-70 family RNA polymerase sigma factor [Shimia sp. SDUM112013]|uniref:sigma-70 family RNA polymerase sigma factor n=1 Tax=Shimia sp. SDUM112013 TaxID=3136160 RepID=UPI0032EBC695